MTGQYTRIGIVDEGMYEWTTLEPFLHALPPGVESDPDNPSTGLPVSLRHDWGNRYILELCSWIIEEPRLGGDHLWIRLKTPGMTSLVNKQSHFLKRVLCIRWDSIDLKRWDSTNNSSSR